MDKTNKKQQATWEKMKTANVVAVVIVFYVMALTAMLFFKTIPEGNKDILNTTVSFVIGTGLSAVVFYLFGYRKQDKRLDQFEEELEEFKCKDCPITED